MPVRSRLRSILFSTLVGAAACSGQRAAPSATSQASAAMAVPMPAIEASAQIARDDQRPAPWTLTASDGSGLALTRVDARAVFQGPLAFTELHLYFHNPENRQREGTFAIALPAHAAVSRFAMETNGRWMEAEVVEKMTARRAYEDFLHRRQDPALLEKAAGNQFTARVFPIPANGDKHIVISFSQELPGERYVLPLRGLPKVERVDAHLELLGADGKVAAQELHEKNWAPDRDLVSTAPLTAEAISAGAIVAAQVPIMDQAAGGPDVPKAITLLVDTSASRSLGYAGAVHQVSALVAALRVRHGDALPLQVVAFDQETQPIFEGAASAWGAAEEQKLLDRGAAGASDLGQALAWLGVHAPKSRVAVLTDGVVTAGEEAAALVAQAKQLRGVERFDVVLAGGIRDDGFAGQLARAGAHPGAVLDLDAGLLAGAEKVAAGMDERVLVDVQLDVPGAAWVFPRTIPSVRAGQRVMVYAKLPAPAQTFDAVVNGQRRSIGLVAAAPALVSRAAEAAEIAELDERLGSLQGDAATKLRAEIAKRAIAARVVSSQTSMLVLESDSDYARFGIDRKALADILVVGPRGLEQQHRAAEIAADPTPVVVPEPPKRKLDADSRMPPAKVVKLAKEEESFESSGSGTAMALDEGRMGRRELDSIDDKAPMAAADIPMPGPAGAPNPAPAAPPRVEPPPPPAYHRATHGEAVVVTGRIARPDVTIAQPEPDISSMPQAAPWPPPDAPIALSGPLGDIEHQLGARRVDDALATARAWHEREPGDVLALIGLGDALEAKHDLGEAARMYGSIIDLYPSRADLRRFAGERLERIAATSERDRALAVDTYTRAVAERPDHLTGHRLLAYALYRAGQPAKAFDAILAGIDQPYPSGRFLGAERVLREDAGLLGAALVAADPSQKARVVEELGKRSAALPTGPSTRFILYWETDANDVDFHIQDARGGHAWYGSKQLPSGGELYADITTGYGPECFAINGAPPAGPYKLSLQYYSQGPMGYGMGLLQIVRADGKGGLAFEDRPYVIMANHAYVDLGTFKP